MNALGNEKLTGNQKEELMDQVKQQIAVANAQELLQVSKIFEFVLSVHRSDNWSISDAVGLRCHSAN